MRRWLIALVAVLGMAGAGVVAAAPAWAAGGTNMVVNTRTGQTYPDLPDAVAAAAPGDTLSVKGTVVTGILPTFIDKNLTITGNSTDRANPATVASQVGSVVEIESGVTVTLSSLTISDLHTVPVPHGGWSAIVNDGGTVTLNNLTVSNNANPTPSGGGGILNNGGTMTLNSTTVSNNTAVLDGGGIFNNGGTMTLNHSTVSNNTTTDYQSPGQSCAGGIGNTGTMTLNRSTVTGNSSTYCGGGIATGCDLAPTCSGPPATLTLDDSTVRNNNTLGAGLTTGLGGGIFNGVGTVILSGSSTVTGNNAGTSGNGGGIWTACGSHLAGAIAGTGGNVYSNAPDDIFTFQSC